MYVPEKLKLNKFVKCSIPRASVIVNRLGGRVPTATDCSGDQTLPLYQTKLEELRSGQEELMRRFDELRQKESDSE